MKQATLHHSRKKIFEAVKQAANELRLEVRSFSLADGSLSLYSGGGFFSYGNEISVEIKISDNSKCVLKIESKSAAAIQVVDWGTNSDLEEKTIEKVKNILNG